MKPTRFAEFTDHVQHALRVVVPPASALLGFFFAVVAGWAFIMALLVPGVIALAAAGLAAAVAVVSNLWGDAWDQRQESRWWSVDTDTDPRYQQAHAQAARMAARR